MGILSIKKINWRLYATIVASVLAVAFIYWQWGAITKSYQQIKTANPMWLFCSIAAQALSVVSAAVVYWQLVLRKTKFVKVFVAQAASLFTARVTPAGVGGVATMGRVLSNSGHKIVELGAVISANAIITFFGNIFITVLALALSGQVVPDDFMIPKIIFLLPVFGVIIFIFIYFVEPWRLKAKEFMADLWQTVKLYKSKKANIAVAFAAGVLTTLCYTVALWAAGMSIGVELSFLVAVVTVSVGTLGASATPLPGGVIGAEATLALTMSQFGVPFEKALAVAFVYRFITYWLPIIPGYIATEYALRKKIF